MQRSLTVCKPRKQKREEHGQEEHTKKMMTKHMAEKVHQSYCVVGRSVVRVFGMCRWRVRGVWSGRVFVHRCYMVAWMCMVVVVLLLWSSSHVTDLNNIGRVKGGHATRADVAVD